MNFIWNTMLYHKTNTDIKRVGFSIYTHTHTHTQTLTHSHTYILDNKNNKDIENMCQKLIQNSASRFCTTVNKIFMDIDFEG